MKRNLLFLSGGILLSLLFFTGAVFSEEVLITDIQANPARYWNRTVTIIGQVQAVKANPEGTTRGTYTLLDDSSTKPMTVKTKDLPPVGRTYAVTGVIIQETPQATEPVLQELKRASPGYPALMKYLLILGGLVFLALLVVFIVLLTKPKKAVIAPATIRPGARPVGIPDMAKTVRVTPGPAEAPGVPPVETQVFMSLGADIVVEKGPDKGKEFTLHKQVTLIGRPGTRKNDIELNDETVSKEQASIFYDNIQKLFTLSNESTTNPTKINNQIATSPTLLENNSVIEIGKTALRFKKT
jgi:hypothetical protein